MIKWVNTSKILRRMSSNAKHYKNLNYNHCFTQSFHLLVQVLIVTLPYIFGISEYLWQVLLNLLPRQLSWVTSNTVDLVTLRQPTTRKSDSLLRWTMQRNWGKQQNRKDEKSLQEDWKYQRHNKGQKWQGPNRSRTDKRGLARIHRTIQKKVFMIWLTMMMW